MVIYWLMFAVPAVLALVEPPGDRRAAMPAQVRVPYGFLWALVTLALIVIIGLR